MTSSGKAAAAATAAEAVAALVLLSILYTTEPAFGRSDAPAFGANAGQLPDAVTGIAGRLVKFLAALQLGLVGGGAVAGVRDWRAPGQQGFRGHLHLITTLSRCKGQFSLETDQIY